MRTLHPAPCTLQQLVAALARCRPAASLLLLFLVCGCAGYRLGPTNGMVPGSKSIQVSLFQNRTIEPRVSEAVASALRRNLQRDGTFTLNTEGDADILISGVVTDYGRRPLTYQRRDVLSARDFRVTMTAKVKAVERPAGKVLLDREVTGTTMVRIDPEQNSLGVGSDQSSVERQALPLLAEDLARRVTSLLVDGEW